MGKSNSNTTALSKPSGFSSTKNLSKEELVSAEEFKKHLGKFKLSDKVMANLKNNIIGIVNTAIDTYLDDFR